MADVENWETKWVKRNALLNESGAEGKDRSGWTGMDGAKWFGVEWMGLVVEGVRVDGCEEP